MAIGNTRLFGSMGQLAMTMHRPQQAQKVGIETVPIFIAKAPGGRYFDPFHRQTISYFAVINLMLALDQP